jgi:hypothetical protein
VDDASSRRGTSRVLCAGVRQHRDIAARSPSRTLHNGRMVASAHLARLRGLFTLPAPLRVYAHAVRETLSFALCATFACAAVHTAPRRTSVSAVTQRKEPWAPRNGIYCLTQRQAS